VFRYTELSFDTTAQNKINDAFEVSLVDSDGFSLVSTVSIGQDAFLNVTEHTGESLGSGTKSEGDAIRTVSIDLSDVPAGSSATIRFRLVNNDGDTESTVRILDVLAPSLNSSPIISDIADINTEEGDTVYLRGSFIDVDTTDTHSAVIDWGDGIIETAQITKTSNGGNVFAQHVYADNGSFRPKLRVTDSNGNFDEYAFDAFVINVAPTVEAGFAFELGHRADDPRMVVRISGEATDPGFDRPASDSSEVISVKIDWGDGIVEDALAHILPGSEGVLTKVRFSSIHQYSAPGIYEPIVRVADDDGGESRTEFRYGIGSLDVTRGIDLTRGGSVPVIVKRESGFDAANIDPFTARFGPGGAIPANGIMQIRPSDVRFNFAISDSGIRPGDRGAFLTGKLKDGTVFAAFDTFDVTPTSSSFSGSPPGETKFYVVDSGTDQAFRYSSSGDPTGTISLVPVVSNVRDVTSIASGEMIWIVDGSSKSIAVQSSYGQKLGSWIAPELQVPEGLTTDGTDIWVVDAGLGVILRFPEAASQKSGSAWSSSSFRLDEANLSPTGIATNGTVFWVTDDKTDSVFVYSMAGVLLGNWKIDSRNADPSGITNDPAGGTYLWIVDRNDRAVYAYAGATENRSGTHGSSSIFTLSPSNNSPEGIADPDPGIRISINALVTGSISVPLGQSTFLFDAAPGDRLFFDSIQNGISSSLDWSLTDPNGVVIFDTRFVDHDVLDIASHGTFSLTIRSRSSVTTGSFQFKIWGVPAVSTTTITIDQVVTGSISIPGESFSYTFFAESGQRLFFDVQDSSTARIGFTIKKADGAILSVKHYDDRDVFVIDESGQYIVEVDDYLRIESTGNFKFRIWNVPPVTTTPIVVEQSVSGQISIPGQEFQYTFQATVGQRLFFDVQDSSTARIGFTIDKPDGTVFFVKHYDDRDVFVVDEAGVYKITVSDYRSPDSTGNFKFKLWEVPEPIVSFFRIEEIVSGSLLVPGEEHIYEFDAVLGQRLFLDVQDNTFGDIGYSIIKPDGTTLFTSSYLDRGVFEADMTGVYKIIVGDNFGIDSTGAYRFQVREVPAVSTTSIEIGDVVSGELTIPGELHRYTFSATAGQFLYFDVRDAGLYNNRILFSLQAPDGSSIQSSSNQDKDFFSASQSGNYTIVVDGRALDDVSTYSFSVVQFVSPGQNTAKDSLGTNFWLTFPANNTGSVLAPTAPNIRLFVTSETDTRGMVYAPKLGSPGAGFAVNFVVRAGETTTVELPPEADLAISSDSIGNKGIRVTSESEISLYALNQIPNTTDAYLALPADLLGNDYIVLGYETTVGASFSGTQPTQFAIVGTVDGTRVTITPSVTTGSRNAGVPYTITLNRGQTYQLQNGTVGADLSGTIIESTHPISVFGANRCTRIPFGYVAADLVMEQLPPVETWGTQFLSVPLATRLGGDTFRFLASQDNTTLRINDVVVATFNRGQYHEQIVPDSAVITSDKPILVAQYANSQAFDGVMADPFMMLVPPFEQFLASYTVSTPTTGISNNFVNLVAPLAAVGHITLDGIAIPVERFSQIGSSGFFGAQISVSIGSHRFDGPLPFGTFVYGFDVYDSYGYPGGMNLASIADIATIDISPASAVLPVGSTHEVAAVVRNDEGMPIPGIRVDFYVEGANESTAFGFTDTNGRASFSYFGAEIGTDFISARSGERHASAVASWTVEVLPPTMEIFSPSDGRVEQVGKSIIISGNVRADRPDLPFGKSLPNIITHVTVNGVPVEALDSAGNFFAKVEVRLNVNQFDIIAYDSFGHSIARSISVVGSYSVNDNFETLTDVTASFLPDYSRTSFDERSKILFAEWAIRNDGQYPVGVPLYVGIKNISDPTVRLIDPDGFTADGIPYIDFSRQVIDATLDSDERTSLLLLKFLNPNQVRFDYDLIFFGNPNRAPQFDSIPRTESAIGSVYLYQPTAVDQDGDRLTWSLISGPFGSDFDTETGRLRWIPGSNDIGSHSVVIRVSDSRGFSSDQRYLLTIDEPGQNRPPSFVSVPVVSAFVGAEYRYSAIAEDKDGDSLRYSLISGPEGMSIDETSGSIRWTPSAFQSGTNTVRIRALDDQGGSSDQIYTIAVSGVPGNHRPQIISIPTTEFTVKPGFLTRAYEYQVQSVDPNGDDLDFGLLAAPNGMTIDRSSGKIHWIPTPGDVADHFVRILVSDGKGGFDSQEFTLTVTVSDLNFLPSITRFPIRTAHGGRSYSSVVLANDPDGDRLTYAITTGPSGLNIDSSSGLLSWPLVPAIATNYPVELEISDGFGGVVRYSYSIEVNSDPNANPVILSGPPRPASVGSSYRYAINAFDPDDDFLSFDLPVAPDGMAISATGVIIWEPSGNQTGEHDVLVRAIDPQGAVGVQAYRIKVSDANVAPVIVSSPAVKSVVGANYRYEAIAQDPDSEALQFRLEVSPQGMTIDPRSGLIYWRPSSEGIGQHPILVTVDDGEGGTTSQYFELTIVADAPNAPPVITSTPRTSTRLGRTYVHSVEALDPEGDALTYRFVIAPLGMNIGSDGSIVWNPSSAQFGTHDVWIQVDDSRSGIANQMFELEVIAEDRNHAPYIISSPGIDVIAGNPYSYDLRAIDPDGDPLKWSIVSSPAGVSIDPMRGTLRWTPTVDQVGVQRFAIRVEDALGDAITQEFSVDVRLVNQSPMIRSVPLTAATVGNRYIYAVRAVDPEGDALAFSIPNAPAGMSIDSTTGLLSWTPSLSGLGVNQVTLRVTDALGGASEQSFSILVGEITNGRPPVIVSIPPDTAIAGFVFEYAVDAFDPEGTQLSYSLATAPLGMNIDPSTGQIRWIPTESDLGRRQIVVAVRDEDQAVGLQRFFLDVRHNRPPAIESVPPARVIAGQVFRYDIKASDPDGDRLEYDLVNGPSGLTLDPYGRIHWPTHAGFTGVSPVRIEVRDGRGGVSVQEFAIEVVADDQAPAVRLIASSPKVDIGHRVAFTVLATDNVSVASLRLTIDGMNVELDSTGRGYAVFSQPGIIRATAWASDSAGNIGTSTIEVQVIDPHDERGPIVEIASPSLDDDVRGMIAVTGSVKVEPGQILNYYEVEYARAEDVDIADIGAYDPAFRSIGKGFAPVENGNLAYFDPSMLANDSYVIRIVAFNANGAGTAVWTRVNVAGGVKLGEFRLQFTDLEIPLAGIPIKIQREYDSLKANAEQDFGFGWTLGGTDPKIRETVSQQGDGFFSTGAPFIYGTRVYLDSPDGNRIGFTFRPEPKSVYYGTGWTPRFEPDPGVAESLEVDAMTLTQKADGTFSAYLFGIPYNPDRYVLTTRDGTRYEYLQNEGLKTVTATNGVTVSYREDGIFSSLGESVRFTRDSRGRITTITAPDGTVLRYRYSASNDLSTFVDQAGLSTTFSYVPERPHFLQEVKDPRGNRAIRTEYDTNGRVVATIDALGNRTERAYDPFSNAESVKDPIGNESRILYDARGNIETFVNAIGSITRYEYNDPANPDLATRIIDPRGFETQYFYDSRGNLVRSIDALGNTASATFNEKNDIVSATDALGRSSSSFYDVKGNLVAFVNASGILSTITYDTQGRQTSTTDNNGKTTKYEYLASSSLPSRIINPDGTFRTLQYSTLGLPTRITDERGEVLSLTYDRAGKLLSVLDAEGGLTRYSYVGTLLASKIDPLGRTTRFEYDSSDRRIREIDALGGVTHFEYDAAGRLVRTTDALGRSTTNTYRADGELAAVTDALGFVTQFEFDAAGNRTAEIDALGRRRTYEFDALNRLIAQNDCPCATEYISYDAVGSISTRTDRNGNVTQFRYDALNRLIASIDALGGITASEYDPNDNLVALTDANGHTTRYEYDSRNRLIRETDPLGYSISYDYDAAGNRIAQVDQLGFETKFTFDGMGRPVSTIDALGGSTTNTYDLAGNLTSVTDPLGRRKSFEYDALNRIVTEIDPLGGVIRYTFDAVGNQTSLTDPVGNQSIFVFDDLDRMVEEIDPLGASSTVVFDPVGNVIETIDRNGRKRTYAYDILDRQVEETWWTGDTSVRSIRTEYDHVGNVVFQSDDESSYRSTYDALNRVVSIDNLGTPGTPRVVLTNAYDAVGNRIEVRDNAGVSVRSVYDARNSLVSRTWEGGDVDQARIDFGYDPRGGRTEILRFADLDGTDRIGRSTVSFDALGRTSGITHFDAVDSVLADYDYRYDSASQLIEEIRNGERIVYGNDPTGQLTSADRDFGTDETYSYDLNGNRTLDGYLTGPGNRLLSDGRFDYVYDAEGNTILKTEISTGFATAYEYDHRNRLISVVERSAGGIILNETAYVYDVADRLIARVVNGQVMHTVYGDVSAWADFADSGSVVARYLHGDRIDEILARSRPSDGSAWYLVDKLGTIRALANSSGVVVNHLDYDSFGNLVLQTNPAAGDRFGFTGREFEASIGLYYFRARFYDATTGRFVNEDPIRFDAGDTNVFRYVGNSVTILTDPSGNSAISYGTLSSGISIPLIGILTAFTTYSYLSNNQQTFGSGKSLFGVTFEGILLTLDVALSLPALYNKPGTKTVIRAGKYVVASGTTPDDPCKNKRPPNLSPEGAKRRGALREAKRRNGIPMNQKPTVRPALDRHKNPTGFLEYVYTNLRGEEVVIRDDGSGHTYRDDPSQNRGPHFNCGEDQHYDY
jgi:RHS repeat-associated protein